MVSFPKKHDQKKEKKWKESQKFYKTVHPLAFVIVICRCFKIEYTCY